MSSTVLVLNGAILAGGVQLRANGLIDKHSSAALSLEHAVVLTLLSIMAGVGYLLARLLEAEAQRRLTVTYNPATNKKYNQERWVRIGIVAHLTSPWVIAVEGILWLMASFVYAGVLFDVL